ncbi:MAG TPA: hypothetical protein VFQ67_05730 [Allosphingosinicella sp.]|jgi:hypothetical protein|nr:hypothetical protein [Allosphingosinicella sp.]
MKTILICAAASAALAAAAGAVAGTHAEADREGEALSALINRELRSGGSWFTPAERAVIERKCGYAPGEWDGFEANLSNGRFTCRNGRVVADDPEMRAVLRAAEPRIRARVEAVMARADVTAAIERVARVAAAEALGESRR